MERWGNGEVLFHSERTLVSRVLDLETQQTSIIKSLASAYPTSSDLAHFFHEYEILLQLSSLDGIIPPKEKILYQGFQSIVFPDTQASSLSNLVTKQMELSLFYKVAISIAETLGRVHSKGIIHKDINPNNIISLPDYSKIWIIDYSISSKTRKELQELKPVQQLEGSLPYLAPEQSGRIQRSLDYRADYYSLGITLFELLIGKKPFLAEDFMELLHQHMVDPLPDLTQLRADVPQALTQVIRKLVAKDPNDRYHSTWGLVFDLKSCLAMSSKEETTFTVGLEDFSEQLMIPEKVYGRENETQALLKVFDLINSRKIETQGTFANQGLLTLIAGPSGVGKSALIHELYKPVAETGAYLVEGKVDQFQRDIILFGFKVALLSLFDLLAGESIDLLNEIKRELAQTLKSNVGVITDIMPELSVYIGEYPKPNAIAPDETRKRLLEAFTVLFQTITARKSLVVYIDDLQWADLTTLDVVEHLARTPLPGFMLLGAYRTSEVAEGHPFHSIMKNLGPRVYSLNLEPLGEPAIHEFLMDALGKPASLDIVTKKMIQKTGGSPFFVHQLLKNLYSDDILVRDPVHKAWQVDLERLDSLQVSTNIVEYLIAKLRTLEPSTQDILSAGAAYGSRFSFNLVAQLLRRDPDSLISAIQKAIDEEIIRPVQGNYQHLISGQKFSPEQKLEFQFLHDRLQQASYELKSESERERIHFDLAELLSGSATKLNDSIAIAEQYLKTDLHRLSAEHRLKIANHFVQAAIQVKNSSGFKKALAYAEMARSICDDTAWESHSSFMGRLYLELAEIAYRAGKAEICNRVCHDLLAKTQNNFERAEAYQILSGQYSLDARPRDALAFGLKSLASLGINLHENTSVFTVVKHVFLTLRALKNIYNQGNKFLPILELPTIHDAKILMIQKNLGSLGNKAYYLSKINLAVVVACLNAELTLKYGLSEFAITAINNILVLYNLMGNYVLSRELGEIGLRLITHPVSKDKANVAYGYAIFAGANSFVHCKDAEIVKHCLLIFDIASEAKEYHGIEAAYLAILSSGPSSPLSILGEFKSLLHRIEKIGNELALLNFSALFEFYECLHAQTKETASIHRTNFENTKRRMLEINDKYMGVGTLGYLTILNGYLFHPLSKNELELWYEKKVTATGAFTERLIEIFYSLTLLSSCRKAKRDLNFEERLRLFFVRRKMKRLSEYNPSNFAFYHFFIEAEYAYHRNKSENVITAFYRQAISAAEGASNFLMAALISEMTGTFYLNQGNLQVGGFYLRKAHSVYTGWEAWELVRSLEERFANVFNESKVGSPASKGSVKSRKGPTQGVNTGSTISSDLNLDFSEILKAARSLSSEVALGKLTEKLLKIVSQVSGAEKGALLLVEKGGTLKLHSQFDKNVSNIFQETQVPLSVITRVQTKKEPLIVEDATKEGRFTSDPYFQNKTIRSVACVPTLNQGKLLAILYLENNEISGAFTEARMSTLDIISSQAAVSIKNAIFYETLEEKVKERTAQLALKTSEIQVMLKNLRQGVFTIQKDLTIHAEYSSYLEIILEQRNLAGQSPLPLLFNHPSVGSNTRDQIKSTLLACFDESILTFEINYPLLPTQIIRKMISSENSGKDQYLELDWRPIFDSDENTEKILVTLRDVTELRQVKEEAESQKTELKMIGELIECGVDLFLSSYKQAQNYFGESRSLVANQLNSIAPISHQVINHLFRNLHTLKGNTRTLGLSFAVDTLHDAEHYLDELRKDMKTPVQVQRIQEDLNRSEEVLRRYFLLVQSKLSSIVHSDVGDDSTRSRATQFILETIRANPASKASEKLKVELFDQFYTSLSYQPLDEILGAELRALPELAQSLGKGIPKLEIQDETKDHKFFLLHADHTLVLRDIFTHILRNALTHGIESAEKRKEKIKSEIGKITITIHARSDNETQIDLIVSDDGQGLNLEAIQKKGLETGTCSTSASDLEIAALIFQPGLSTAEAVTTISGRGVGMDAVSALTEKHGGKISIEFTGEKNLEGYRPFQLRISLPLDWKHMSKRNNDSLNAA